MPMTREEMAQATYDYGMGTWGDENMADALRDSVMGDLDEGATEEYWADLLHETAQAMGHP